MDGAEWKFESVDCSLASWEAINFHLNNLSPNSLDAHKWARALIWLAQTPTFFRLFEYIENEIIFDWFRFSLAASMLFISSHAVWIFDGSRPPSRAAANRHFTNKIHSRACGIKVKLSTNLLQSFESCHLCNSYSQKRCYVLAWRERKGHREKKFETISCFPISVIRWRGSTDFYFFAVFSLPRTTVLSLFVLSRTDSSSGDARRSIGHDCLFVSTSHKLTCVCFGEQTNNDW